MADLSGSGGEYSVAGKSEKYNVRIKGEIMHIETLRIRNFRRLQDVRIDLAADISIFVGANNSRKTSASHALQLFMAASRERFSVHDFSAECWATMDAFGDGVDGAILPTISLDVWF